MVRRYWKPNPALKGNAKEMTCGNCAKRISLHEDNREYSCITGDKFKAMVVRKGDYVTVTSPCSGHSVTYFDPDKVLIAGG